MRSGLAVVALGLLWAGCSAPLRLIGAMASTVTLPATLTVEPTLSPTTTPTSTMRPTPSPRPPPTIDLAATPFPTPTSLIPSPSRTATSVPSLDCRLDWQSPGDGAKFEPYELFTVGWHVTNTGAEVWSPASVEFSYLSGAKPSRDSVIPLKSAVAPGQSVILTAQLRAPRNSALYTTHWGLRQGDTSFCRVSVSIYVK